jgi:hypothetical protein
MRKIVLIGADIAIPPPMPQINEPTPKPQRKNQFSRLLPVRPEIKLQAEAVQKTESRAQQLEEVFSALKKA